MTAAASNLTACAYAQQFACPATSACEYSNVMANALRSDEIIAGTPAITSTEPAYTRARKLTVSQDIRIIYLALISQPRTLAWKSHAWLLLLLQCMMLKMYACKLRMVRLDPDHELASGANTYTRNLSDTACVNIHSHQCLTCQQDTWWLTLHLAGMRYPTHKAHGTSCQR